MTKTEHYQLNQWDPEDPIRRTDFNADNAKLDTALKTLDTGLGTLNTALSSLSATVAGKMDAAAGNAAIAEKCRIAIGTYTGNGTATQLITLGFRPKAVLVWITGRPQATTFTSGTSQYGGLTVDDGTAKNIVTIVNNGFQAFGETPIQSNIINNTYYYIAFG